MPLWSAKEEESEEIDITELYSGFISELPTIVSTPVGMYRLHDRMSPTKQFDCWMGYTNFDITEEVKDTIKEEIKDTTENKKTTP